MSKRTQPIKVNDPECLQKLPPHVVLSLDGTTPVENDFLNLEVTSGSGGTIFKVVPTAETIGYATAITEAGGNTGDGTIASVTCSLTTVSEDWTITCTDDSVAGAEVFSVTGTVSGLQTAEATANVEYTSDGGEVVFTIESGATDFVETDEITFTTSKQSSYIKALSDCRLIVEGLVGRTTATSPDVVALDVGTEAQNYGQTAQEFIHGVPCPADYSYMPVSSTVQLTAGQGLSFRYVESTNDAPVLAALRVSSVFPE